LERAGGWRFVIIDDDARRRPVAGKTTGGGRKEKARNELYVENYTSCVREP
jgi:hypothetical protein